MPVRSDPAVLKGWFVSPVEKVDQHCSDEPGHRGGSRKPLQKVRMIGLDINVLVRYLVQDYAMLAVLATRLIEEELSAT